jgi:hypothetical protein
VILPQLIARGLLGKKKILFLTHISLTPEGKKQQAKIKSDLARANLIPNLLKTDPAQAAAIAAAIGATILLADKLPPHFKLLADAMKIQFPRDDFTAIDGGASGGGFDFGSFDLGSFDAGAFDAGGFDAGMSSFDAGFSDGGFSDGGAGHSSH